MREESESVLGDKFAPERCAVCPDEIAEGQSSISIIDNDDFLNDTLTGGGTAHRCNWMFLQRLECQGMEVRENEANIHVQIKDPKTVSRVLTEKVSEMQTVTPYRTIKRGEPPIRPKPTTFSSSTEAQRKRSIIHVFSRSDMNGAIPSYSGMLPWMIAYYDNNRYGRWLPDFWAMLTDLPVDQVAFLQTDFTQSITGNPYSNMAWDMWIECTMNKGSKMKSGWLSILQNEKQQLVHSRNVNNVAQIRAAHNALANRKEIERKHKECSPKRMREDEQCVQDLIACLNEFDSFPFDPASPTLHTLQSAMPASDNLIVYFNSTHTAGEKKLTSFLAERVFSKRTSLHARVPLNKRLTFAKGACMEKSMEDLKVRAAKMEQNALKAVIDLVEVSQLANLHELLEHRVIEECVALFNSNGSYRKTQKSKLIQKLTLQSVDLQEPHTALIDMGMIWRMATPS